MTFFLKERPLIRLHNLSFRYEDRLVLEKVSLELKKGGFYIFVGPNGGGKTTLLKIILGVLQPTSGSVTIADQSPRESRSLIGYVPQTFLFDPCFPLTVEEFVLMGCLAELPWYGRWPKGIKTRVQEALEFVEIFHLKDRSIGSLSGGQRQRASLARALISNPEILLLDEPTTGLDPEASLMIQNKVRQLKGLKTIIFVTHTTPELFKDIDAMICVKGNVEIIPPESICEHHALGVFHPSMGGWKEKK